MEKITDIDLVMRTLEEVVNEFGEDHEAPILRQPAGSGCVYVMDDKPSCIVGQVLYRLGVPLEELHKYEGEAVISSSFDFIFSADVTKILSEAQFVQDGRRTLNRTWGEALEKARITYDKIKARTVVTP